MKDINEDPSDPLQEVAININGHITMVSSLRATHLRNGVPIAHRETGAIPQTSDSTVEADGGIVSLQRGIPAQGEQQTEATCRKLAEVWRVRGRTSMYLNLADSHDDCDCFVRLGSSERVQIQVVRADANPEGWRELARHNEFATASDSAADRALVIRGSIEKKLIKLPAAQRKLLVLALDATTSSAYALGAVVIAFREQFGQWAKGSQFREIWLVGPDSVMTYRLDEKEPADAA